MPTLSFDWFFIILIVPLMFCVTWYNVTKIKCNCYYLPEEDDE
jgi:hypothetical protein